MKVTTPATAKTRIAAARARAGTRSKASGTSTKAAAGYFLDPESGKRRRQTARERAVAVIRRGNGHRAEVTEEATAGAPEDAGISR
jgi:hypothetical protein